MKNKIVSVLLFALLCLASPPAGAQVVSDPAAAALLQQILANQVTQTSQQVASMPKEILSESHLMDQVNQMIADHVDTGSIFKQLGPTLSSTISSNMDMMTNTQSVDKVMNDEFRRLVPQYQAGSSYLGYVNTLNANTNTTYAQALGIANANVASQADIKNQLTALDSAPPTNQMQALMQMVGIGKMQVQQMDKLIKIQAAMLKSMAVTYQAKMGASLTGATTGGASDQATLEYCTATTPYFGTMSAAAQRAALVQCKASLAANQASPSP